MTIHQSQSTDEPSSSPPADMNDDYRSGVEANNVMNISVTVNLPSEITDRLQSESGDLSSAIRESFAINLFRRGILTHHELGRELGLDRFETDALLKRNEVTEYSLSHEDIEADISSLKEFLGLPRP